MLGYGRFLCGIDWLSASRGWGTGYTLDWDLGGPPGCDGSGSCLISGDLNCFRLAGRVGWETTLVCVVVRVIPNDR
jgi:hypothetical protein